MSIITRHYIVDPFNKNIAIEIPRQPLDTDEFPFPRLLSAVRMLPADSPHLLNNRQPTLAEIKAAPIVGYAPPVHISPCAEED